MPVSVNKTLANTLGISNQMGVASNRGRVPIGGLPTFNYLPAHGQSLSIGDQALPVHTTETFGDTVNLFNGLKPIGAGFEIVPDDSVFQSLVPYKETGKETHGWSMFNYMQQQGVLTGKWLYAAYGVGGKTIAELTDAPDPTGWGWSKVERGNDFAKQRTPEGHEFKVPFTTWIHGEADSAGDQAAYKTKLRSYHDRLIASTGKVFPMFLDQTGKLASVDIATTLLEYSLSNPDAFMVLPKYWLNRLYFGDSIRLHLSNAGYQLQGEYFGRAISNYLKTGQHYGSLYPSSISVSNNYKRVSVTFNVPQQNNLVIDTSTLPAAPGLGLGLTYLPGFTQIAALSYMQDGNTIHFDFAEYVTTEAILNLGNTLSDAANNGGIQLPCINIRDDAAEISPTQGVRLYNWCCQRKIIPSVVDGALNRFTDNLWLNGDFSGTAAANTTFAGRTTDWIIRNLGSTFNVSFTVNITSGSMRFWCGDTSQLASTSGTYSFTATVTTAFRLYLISGASGFTGAISNINVRFVS